jgi:hypothetical protein
MLETPGQRWTGLGTILLALAAVLATDEKMKWAYWAVAGAFLCYLIAITARMRGDWWDGVTFRRKYRRMARHWASETHFLADRYRPPRVPPGLNLSEEGRRVHLKNLHNEEIALILRAYHKEGYESALNQIEGLAGGRFDVGPLRKYQGGNVRNINDLRSLANDLYALASGPLHWCWLRRRRAK